MVKNEELLYIAAAAMRSMQWSRFAFGKVNGKTVKASDGKNGAIEWTVDGIKVDESSLEQVVFQ